MRDMFTALALVLVIEGLVWALFPDFMKRMAAQVMAIDSQALRWGGLVIAVVGLGGVWAIRH